MDRKSSGDMDFDPSMFEITDEKFKQYLDSVVSVMKNAGLGKKSMPPHVVAFIRPFMPDGGPALGDIEMVAIGINDEFNEAKHKRAIMEQIGAKFRTMKVVPVAVFLASEVWMAQQDPKAKKNMMPRDDPNRSECLMVCGRTLPNDCKAMVAIEVKRDADDIMRQSKDPITITDKAVIGTGLIDTIFNAFLDESIELEESCFNEVDMGDDKDADKDKDNE